MSSPPSPSSSFEEKQQVSQEAMQQPNPKQHENQQEKHNEEEADENNNRKQDQDTSFVSLMEKQEVTESSRPIQEDDLKFEKDLYKKKMALLHHQPEVHPTTEPLLPSPPTSMMMMLPAPRQQDSRLEVHPDIEPPCEHGTDNNDSNKQIIMKAIPPHDYHDKGNITIASTTTERDETNNDTSDSFQIAQASAESSSPLPYHSTSTVGAVRIEGFGLESTRPSLVSTAEQSTEERNQQDEVLLEAQLVETEEIFEAKADPWWRRYQWWIAGLTFTTLIGVVMIAVFTTVDLSPGEDPPSAAPSSFFVGFQTEIMETLLLSSLPGLDMRLSNASTPQYAALEWLANSTFSMPMENRGIIQQFSLATLFFSTSMNAWNDTLGWLQNDDECNWYGVECAQQTDFLSPSKRIITSLSLQNNGLNGILPPEIALLADGLTRLDLSNNRVMMIPSEIGLLTNLIEFNLGAAKVHSDIPTTIGLLVNLQNWDISENHLTGTIPTELGELTALVSLDLSKNDLQGSLASEVGLLGNLTHFDFSSNKLNFALPTEIGLLSKLESFDASSNFIQGPLPSEIGTLNNLSFMNMHSNSLAGSIPLQLGFISKLTFLDLSYNLLTGTIPLATGSLSSLTSLRLAQNFLRGPVPNSISQLNLTSFDLSNNLLSRPLPSDIWEMVSLVVFNISKNGNLYTTIPTQINRMTNLKILDLSNTIAQGTLVTEVGQLSGLLVFDVSFSRIGGTLPSEYGHMSSLETLDLGRCRVYGSIPTDIGRMTALKSLLLYDTDLDPEEISGTIPSELGMLTLLTRLELRSTKVRGTIPTEIAQLSALKRLDLSLTDIAGALPSEIGSLSRLESLLLPFTNIVGSLSTSIGGLVSLKEFDLRSTDITGVLPSEIGLMTSLEDWDLQFTGISGAIPTEIGLMTSLTSLLFVGNAFSGSTPSEIGSLTHLTRLEIQNNRMVTGVIPSEIGHLTSLMRLILQTTSISSSIPTEIGNMRSLESFSIAGTNISGRIPLEFALLTNLRQVSLGAPALTGSIPESLCNETVSMFVFCEQVLCTCCGCISTRPPQATPAPKVPDVPPTPSPVTPPSAAPTSVPSNTPTSLPSSSPTESMIPSLATVCSPFSSIASSGTLLSISNLDEGIETVQLPFSFLWRGTVAYNEILVTSNGVLFLGVDQTTNSPTGCCDAFPVLLGGNYDIPRIAIAQTDLSPNLWGSIYVTTMKSGEDDVWIVSWEGVSHCIGAFFAESFFNFQVALFSNGDIEFRWGEADTPLGVSVAAGLEDDGAGMAVPVTGEPFQPNSGGLTAKGSWPTDQCRRFTVMEAGKYSLL